MENKKGKIEKKEKEKKRKKKKRSGRQRRFELCLCVSHLNKQKNKKTKKQKNKKTKKQKDEKEVEGKYCIFLNICHIISFRIGGIVK